MQGKSQHLAEVTILSAAAPRLAHTKPHAETAPESMASPAFAENLAVMARLRNLNPN